MKLSKEDQIRLAAIRALMKLNDELKEERYRPNNCSQSTVEKPRNVELQIDQIQPSWELIKFLVDVIDKLIG